MDIGIYSPRVGFATSGGTETVVRELTKQMAKRHDVTLYTGVGKLLPEVERLDAEVVQVECLRKEDRLNERLTSLTPFLSAEIESVSMYRHARSSDVFDRLEGEDVISTHYYLDNILLSRTLDVPNLFHIPGIRNPSIRWRAMARFASPDAYLATSEDTRQRSQEWLGIDVDGIVYPAVDREQFNPDATPAFEVDQPVVLFVGRLQEGKGVPDLLEAFDRLDTDAVLFVVGDGPKKSDFEAKANELGIGDAVEFTGPVPHQEIHGYFAASDVFCLPSYHEGFPVVNLEALASRKPIVSTSIDAIAEQVEDGTNGYLVTPGDIEGLAGALDRLLADPQRREAFGTESWSRSEQFTWDRQARKLETHLRRIAEADD